MLAEARARAQDTGFLVLSARGAPLEAEYPFGVVRQLLDWLAADRDRSEVMFGGAGVAATGVFAPGSAWSGAPDATFAVLHGLFWALANVAGAQPVLVCVDDVQWADVPSLRFLDFLAGRVGELAAMLLVALRSGEARDSRAVEVLSEFEAGLVERELRPAPLSEEAVLELTRARFGGEVDGVFAAACHARTGGNPLFVAELHHELLEAGVPASAAGAERVARTAPRAVGRVVLARLARHGRDAVGLARAVALLGDRARLADAAELAGLDRARAADAARGLIEAGFLGPGERLAFVHPLIGDAIEEDAPRVVRAEEHARAARVLAARGRDEQVVAAHVLVSAPAGDQWAVGVLRAAAAEAVGRGAPEAAVRLLGRALEEPAGAQQAEVLFELGAAEAALQGPGAVAHLMAARDALPAGAARASVALVLARVLMAAGQASEVYRVIEDAQAGLGREDRELALALDALAVNAASIDPGGGEVARERVDGLVRLEGTTPGERAGLACAAFLLARSDRPVSEALELLERAIGGGQWGYAAAGDTFAPLAIVTALHWCSEIGRAVTLAGRLVEEAAALGSPLLFAEASTARALAGWRGGMLRDAEADARQALATTGVPFGQMRTFATQALIGVLSDRGELQDGLGVAQAFRFPAELPVGPLQAVLESAHGQVEVELGRYEQAIPRLTHAGAILESVGVRNPAAGAWRQALALALAALGRHEEARDALAPALAAARRSGGAYELGISLRTAALIEQRASVELLRDALGVLEPSEIRLQHARVLVDLGAALRRQGHRREARDPLAAGLELAERCGARGLLERARTELLAAGGRPRRITRTGADALTASELRVARLASEGLTNREIAQQLFVSPRTVQAQLRSAYAKLRIDSRRQLAVALVR